MRSERALFICRVERSSRAMPMTAFYYVSMATAIFCRFVTFGGASNLVGRPGGWTVSLSGHISSSGQRTTMIFGSNRIYSSTRTRSCKDRGLYPFLWRSRWPYNGPLIWDKKVRTNRIVLFRCNLESEGYNDCFEYPNASINQEAPSVFHMGYI